MKLSFVAAMLLAPATAILYPKARHTMRSAGYPACHRRAVLSFLPFVAIVGLPPAARAAYGDAAQQMAPALVPSPFYPTGAMADTCIQVALGREDVCLVPKKLLSAYDSMLLDKQLDDLADRPGLGADASALLASMRKMLAAVKVNDFSTIMTELASLEARLAQLGSSAGTDALAADLKAVLAGVGALNKELKRPRPELESGPVAKILIKLSAGVSSLVDGLPS